MDAQGFKLSQYLMANSNNALAYSIAVKKGHQYPWQQMAIDDMLISRENLSFLLDRTKSNILHKSAE